MLSRQLVLVVLLALSPLAARSGTAADFSPITEQERALTTAPADPDAAAVVLFKRAEFKMLDPKRQETSSRLTVAVRVKILKEAGKSWGEVAIPHSANVRLHGFEGRTVQPDGTVVPLRSDARFERKLSRVRKSYVTSVAFPAVDVGSILDYRYELQYDSIYYLEPWYLSDQIPVLHSEITYHVPREIQATAWIRDPMQVGVKRETRPSGHGTTLRAWAVNLPSVPDEPHMPPFAEFVTQFMLVPTSYVDANVNLPYLRDWPAACEIVGRRYDEARRKSGRAGQRARGIASAAGAGLKDQAAAVFAFVRDSITTDPIEGVIFAPDVTVDQVIERGTGDSAEKALLLQAMLQALKIEARPAWAALRSRGTIDTQVATPAWFQRVIVAADIEGQRYYLDPSSRGLGFGQLPADLEGMPALIPDAKKPEGVVLPVTPSDRNQRRATVELTVGEDGKVSGRGELLLTGQHARKESDPGAAAEKRTAAWEKWLAGAFEGYAVSSVQVADSAEADQVHVTWTMAERDDAVLGDEVTLSPSRPLGPVTQPFTEPPDRRRSPLRFDFADRQEVELKLRWAPGFKLAATPRPARCESAEGALVTSVDSDESGRSLVYRRRVEVRQRDLDTRAQYESIRQLFGAAEAADAQKLVLVRR